MDGFDVFLTLLMILVVVYAVRWGALSASGNSGGAADNREGQRAGLRRGGRLSPPDAHPAARQAMAQADYQAGLEFVQVVDIGLLAYRTSRDPKLVRQNDVVIDTRYLRPFVAIWLPHRSRGPVRFELFDTQGSLRYADETEYDLQRGVNTLLPDTWLPLQGQEIVTSGQWTMQISAGRTPLARHRFGWAEVGGGDIQQYVAHDGEISPALQNALHHRQREALSLDDLLAGQEE